MPVKSMRVERALKKLGSDIRDARRRRRIPTELMAERMGVSRTTLLQIERGSSRVSAGSYAVAIYILGKIDDLEMLLDRTNDPLGLDLIERELPERIRSKKPR
ncbi:MAG: hypothetical protein LBT23_06820 [Synergistaceae bacterium]|nr:hypothetical protein [Synergistaceae bacterium]